MSTAASASPTHREPALRGQTVLLIGGSAGIGLETGRLARAEGAKLILTGRDSDRLDRAARELGAASTAAFDATDFERLGRFFDEMTASVDHVLVTGPGPYYAPLSEFDLEKARREIEAHLLLPIEVARYAAKKVRPGGTLLFIGGTGGRRTSPGMYLISALTAAMPALTKPCARDRTSSLQSDRGRLCRYAAFGGAARRSVGSAPGATPHYVADPARRWPGGHCCAGRSYHDEHGAHGSNLRHRRRPTACAGLSPSRG